MDDFIIGISVSKVWSVVVFHVVLIRVILLFHILILPFLIFFSPLLSLFFT